jgi:hypothetical protein
MNPMFVRANSALIAKYSKSLLKNKEAGDGLRELEQLWQKEYKAKIVKNQNNVWEFVEFKDPNIATMFILKWE